MQTHESLLDTTMLEQYIDLVGPQLIHQSLEMFEQMMPGYLAVLDSNMTARDQRGSRKKHTKLKGRQVLSVYATYSNWPNRFRHRHCQRGGITCRTGSMS